MKPITPMMESLSGTIPQYRIAAVRIEGCVHQRAATRNGGTPIHKIGDELLELVHAVWDLIKIIAEFIRRNVHSCDWETFFDELRTGPSIHATFQHTRPQPHELRPLNEAARVIEECAPKKMPEDSWDHLYACLEWFALWSQRVIPKAVWQQALQQAKKTVLPESLK